MTELIRCNKRTKQLLMLKKENTGKSIPDLVEYAVFNMPMLKPKELNRYRVKK